MKLSSRWKSTARFTPRWLHPRGKSHQYPL